MKPVAGAVLVGFMGAGKSTVGRIVAGRLGIEFVEIDARIEAAAGKSVGDIFSSEGEAVFRELERKAIREAVSVPGRVIATGGGAFADAANRVLLKRYAPVFFLDASAESVVRRLGGDTTRPLLRGEDRERRVRELMARRRPAYEEADHVVGTDRLTASQVAARVLRLLGGTEGERG